MDSIGEVVDKLVENGCHPGVLLGGSQLADNAFELESPDFALVIELVVQRALNVDVHGVIIRFVSNLRSRSVVPL